MTETISTAYAVQTKAGWHIARKAIGADYGLEPANAELWCELPSTALICRVGEELSAVCLEASRTRPEPVNEPADLPEDLRATFPPSLPANWPDVLESRAKAAYVGDSKGTVDLLRATATYLRAASIPKVEPSPSSPTVGELEAKLSQTRGAAVNELAVEIDANRTLRAQLEEARKVLESAVDFVTESFDQPSDELHALLMQIGEFLASLREKQDAE